MFGRQEKTGEACINRISSSDARRNLNSTAEEKRFYRRVLMTD
jgi:hypothetical protein